MQVGNGPKIDIEPGERAGNFVNAILQSARNSGGAPAAVSRAQRLRNTIRSDRNYSGGRACICAGSEAGKECGSEVGHVAGDHQVPFRLCMSERGVEAAQGAVTGENIFDDGITEVSIPADLSDQGNVIRHGKHLSGNVLYQRGSIQREESLVASHSRTTPPDEDERRALHAEMITLKRLAEISRVTEK